MIVVASLIAFVAMAGVGVGVGAGNEFEAERYRHDAAGCDERGSR